MDLTLKAEQEEYLQEGVTWEPIPYTDNKECVNLIDHKSNGIISLLDETCLIKVLYMHTFATIFREMMINFWAKLRPTLVSTSIWPMNRVAHFKSTLLVHLLVCKQNCFTIYK